MDKLATEAFISWCDDMMIAEESAKAIKQLFEEEMKKVDEIKTKAEQVKGDYPEMIKLYQEALEILTSMKQKVEKMEVSRFDKIRSGASSILHVASMLVGAIGGGVILGVPTAGLGALFGAVGGAVALGELSDKITKKSKGLKTTKEDVLYEIGLNISIIKECITVLQNPTKYKKYLKSDQLTQTDLVIASANGTLDSAKPLFKKLTDELNQRVTPRFKKYKTSGKFVFRKEGKCDGVIEFSDRWFASMIIVDSENINNAKLAESVNGDINDILDEFEKKYEDEIAKLRISFILADYTEDMDKNENASMRIHIETRFS